jgi:hypothetical protein
MNKDKVKQPRTADQLLRFRDMAREVGADESPGALGRAFGKLDPKKRAAPAKPKRS